MFKIKTLIHLIILKVLRKIPYVIYLERIIEDKNSIIEDQNCTVDENNSLIHDMTCEINDKSLTIDTISKWINELNHKNINLNTEVKKQGKFPPGHYYSPIPDRSEIRDTLGPIIETDEIVNEIEISKDNHLELLIEYSGYYQDLFFPADKNNKFRYFYKNNWFPYSDAVCLYSFLRKHKPKKIIEVGSGFSSAVMLDTI